MHLRPVLILSTALLSETASPGFATEVATGFVDVPQGRLWYEASGQGPAMSASGSLETHWHDGGYFALGAGAPGEERRAFLLRALTGAPSPPR